MTSRKPVKRQTSSFFFRKNKIIKPIEKTVNFLQEASTTIDHKTMDNASDSSKTSKLSAEDFDLSDAGQANCCETEVQYAKCSIIWLIKNFSYCRQKQGEALQSCIFKTDEQGAPKFRLDLYPRGTSARPNDLVLGIRLVTDSENVKSFIQYDCCIYNNNTPYYRQRGEFLLAAPGQISEPVVLVSRDKLFAEKEKVLPDDNLGLICAVRATFNEKTGVYNKSKL